MSHVYLSNADNSSASLSIHNTTVRNMDKSGRGYLTNDKVYKLMEESLRLQKDVFKMKKMIVG